LDSLRLKAAEMADKELLFAWANDPIVRQHSFNPAPIPWEMHQRWFTNKLNSSDCLIYIILVAEVPAGMIRFDLKNNQATISYLLQKNFRGQGLGSWVLTAAAINLQQQRPEVVKIIGHVQETNIASVTSFRKAGFTPTTQILAAEPNSLVFEKELN
jgi:UDP-2,4-diacetamido-2,4,6-trideoxy-beta-L-altropyranose hydrolase